MRTAHFDCFSGISGDMTLAALFDVGVPVEPVRAGLASLGLPITLEIEKVRKGGFAATYVHVEAPEQETHRFLHDVEEIIARGQLTDRQRSLAGKIFRRLAQAEATVHGMPLEKVHFHEVGALDSIADIVGAAIGLDLLGVEHFTSGPVAVGSGTVQCAHGLMPVPAPGTAELLKGVPLRSSPVQAELTTPTGAAILTSVVAEWIEQPAMTIERIGHGAGRKHFVEQPNLLRLFVGTRTEPAGPLLAGADVDQVWVLETNLDDVPGEVIGYTHGSAVRRRGPGRLHHADRHEKESARRAADRAGGRGNGAGHGGDPVPRTADVRHPPLSGTARQAAPPPAHGGDRLGPGARQAWLARRAGGRFSRRNTTTAPAWPGSTAFPCRQ